MALFNGVYKITKISLEDILSPGEQLDVNSCLHATATIDIYVNGEYTETRNVNIGSRISSLDNDIAVYESMGMSTLDLEDEREYYVSIVEDYVQNFNSKIIAYEETAASIPTSEQVEMEESEDDQVDEKLAHRAELKQRVEAMSPEDRNTFAKLMQYEVIVDIVDAMKDFERTAEDVWKNLIQRLKNLKGLSGDSSDVFETLLPLLLSAVASFAGMMIAKKKAQQAASEADTEDENPIETLIEKQEEDDEENIKLLLKYAENEEYGFSFTKKDSSTSDKTSDSSSDITKNVCAVSMCENFSEPESIETTFETGKKVFVEFSDTPRLFADIGNEIFQDQVFGKLKENDIKSESHFIIDEISDKYIIGTKVNDSDASINLSSIPTSDTNLNKISETINGYSNVISYIENYLPFAQIPAIANCTKGVTCSISEACEKHSDAASAIISEYQDSIKSISSVEHIKNMTDSDNLEGLRKEIDDSRDKSVSSIKNLYLHPESTGYASAGRICDYYLLSEYISYITGDNFIYDENNEYVVKLYDVLINIISTRIKLEGGGDKITALTAQFDELCTNTISEKWALKTKSYYDDFSDIFKYDAYTDGTSVSDILEYSNGGNKITLYSKIVAYLKNIMGYSDESETNDEKSKNISNIKKIAILFSLIRSSLISSSQNINTSDFISDEYLTNVFTRRKTAEGKEFVDEYKGSNEEEMNESEYVLKKYLGALKNLTDSEEKSIREIGDAAIEWYEENNPKIENNSIFESMIPAVWSSPSTIYYNGEQGDYYYVMEASTTKDDIVKEAVSQIDTAYTIGDYMYWLKYFSMATAINAAFPIYWGLGLLTPTPTHLPIIAIPIAVIPGSVTTVIGLGICGMTIYPLLLFVNMTNDILSCITTVNQTVKNVSKILQNIITVSIDSMKSTVDELEKKINDEIESGKRKVKEIENKERAINDNVETDKKTERALKREAKKKRRKERSKQ